MKITPPTLKKIITNLLAVIDVEGLSDEVVAQRVGDIIKVGQERGDFVEIGSRKTYLQYPASFFLSYMIPDHGVPVEIRLNPDLRYTVIIVKCRSRIRDYSPLFPKLKDPVNMDGYGNLRQFKKLDKSSLELAKKELEHLVATI